MLNKKQTKFKNVLFFLEYKIELIDLNIKNTQSELEALKKKNNKVINFLLKNKMKKKERDSRHYAPANKEWKNNIYTFNKNYMLDIASRDKIANNYIKNYFNMIPIPLIITKSRRMRDLIRRSSTKQLFVSQSEIKQTNDDAIITVYTFDREKILFYRKLFFLRKWLNENLMHRKYKLKRSKNNLIIKLKNSRKIIKTSILYKKHIIYNNNYLSSRKRRNVLKKKLKNYNVKNDLFLKSINIMLKKRKYFINVFFFKCLVSIMNIIYKKKAYFISNNTKYVDFAIKSKKKFLIKKTENGKLKYYKPKPIIIVKNSKLNLKLLNTINILLFNWILKNSKKSYLRKYFLLFNKLKIKYETLIKQYYLRKEMLVVKYLTNLYTNKFKYYNYLPGLKSILSKIYNKKIQFNLVKLKNIHLNSNIFSDAISIKLRKRTQGILRTLRKSFNFVKKIIPNDKYILIQQQKNTQNKEIFTYFGKYNIINGDIINKIFNNMFNNYSTTIKGILKSIKYKWVTGAKIETKGRLTKRYAASRAIYKHKYRGTLKNLEYLKNTENNSQSASVFMLRGNTRPNTQYSLIHSKRRIGAFGIKGWISNS